MEIMIELIHTTYIAESHSSMSITTDVRVL